MCKSKYKPNVVLDKKYPMKVRESIFSDAEHTGPSRYYDMIGNAVFHDGVIVLKTMNTMKAIKFASALKKQLIAEHAAKKA